MAADRQVKSWIHSPKAFVTDGIAFLNKCQKPDKAEFRLISQSVGIGFMVMGAIGFVVKIFHIPINNILVGGQ